MSQRETLHILDPLDIRRELFKLHYPSSSFDLNQKADAFEALD
jgi:hypothetical protein